jgi:NAD(P)H-flavin reductase
MSDGVLHLTVQTAEPLSFVPGQYVPVRIPPSEQSYYYSIASAPSALKPHQFELLVGRPRTGELPELSLGQTLAVELPRGVDVLELAGESRPLKLIGMGTGVAPLRAIVEDCIARDTGRPLTLMVGARDAATLPFYSEFLEYARRGGLEFYPVFSRSSDDSAHRGRVQEHVAELLSSEGFFVLCGSAAMVSGTRAVLHSLGVAEHDIHGEGYGD